MIDSSLPSDIAHFVEEQVAAGHYSSEQGLMVSAVRAIQYVQDRQKQFCDDVRLGMEQLEWGEFNEYDEAGLKSRFQEFKRQAVSGTGKKGGADR